MNYWQRTAEEHAAAWRLLDELKLNVALVREAVPPGSLQSVYPAGGIDKHRRWGSAVVSYGGALREIETVKILCTVPSLEIELTDQIPGEHTSVGAMPRSHQVALADPRRRRATGKSRSDHGGPTGE